MNLDQALRRPGLQRVRAQCPLLVKTASQGNLSCRPMFSGMREQISPTILAVATVLVVLSIFLLTALELLRRRNERMRGLTPG